MNEHAPEIGDYAIIGDCRSAALIARDGSLDWLCWPRFDSPAVFAGILDVMRGGRWQIAPRGVLHSSRRYLPDTNVLETRFETETGVCVLTDFMPLADDDFAAAHLTPDHEIVRILRCENGRVEVDIRFSPRPNFGGAPATIRDRGRMGLRVNSGNGMLALHASLRFQIESNTAIASKVLEKGEDLPLILTYAETSPEVMPLLGDASESMNRTSQWWRTWASTCTYKGPYRHAVMRSALTLKLLEFPASGAFVAAPTTSLPERVGGDLNWDYRYCWLRDASFTIEALCGTGFVPEAEAFAEWLLHATRRTQPKLMVMYDLYGNIAPPERAIERLDGHRGSTPVNVGNGARDQSQLDTYGEVVSGVAKLLTHTTQAADRETSKVLVGFGLYVCKHWRESDAGIWETRDQPSVHTHSRLLCWAALDALIDLDSQGLIRGVPVAAFSAIRAQIRQSIKDDCWCPEIASYTSEPGTRKLDATLLLLTLHTLHEGNTPRMRQTHERVYRELSPANALLYRNLPDDGVPIEGAFGICGFWRANFLALGGGTLAEAERAFQTLLADANDVGLFGEETDPTTRCVLGNFPQAFTHVGLINAALAIEKRRCEDGGDS